MNISNEDLALRIAAGEEHLVQQLWAQTERFSAMQARKYYRKIQEHIDPPPFDVEDLTQEAYFALLDAIVRFNAARGGFLGIYDLCLKTAFSCVSGNRTKFQKRDGLKLSVSGDTPLGEGQSETFFDTIPSDEPSVENQVIEPIYQQELHNILECALKGLPYQQECILRDYFYQNRTCEQIAVDMDCSTSNVSDQKRKALGSLYEKRTSNGLADYVEENTNYYRKMGVQQFKSTNISAVESIVMRREQLAEKWLRQHNYLIARGKANVKSN